MRTENDACNEREKTLQDLYRTFKHNAMSLHAQSGVLSYALPASFLIVQYKVPRPSVFTELNAFTSVKRQSNLHINDLYMHTLHSVNSALQLCFVSELL